MSKARAALLARILETAAAHGLADRSLRDVAEAAGSSHRMVLYHFGSRAGLVAAIVEAVEAAQRDLLVSLAAEAPTEAELVRRLWRRVSSEEMLPFVRLFFECVATSSGRGLTEPWLETAASVTRTLGAHFDPDEIRLGVAVTRGLLIDVLATGDTVAATRSLDRFLVLWSAGRQAASVGVTAVQQHGADHQRGRGVSAEGRGVEAAEQGDRDRLRVRRGGSEEPIARHEGPEARHLSGEEHRDQL